ncbi:hypothetical protein GCM10010994_33950 [Chelatococcus reniformis]|uniref:Uncharacterized protein n=1 Tax=Chelatococcus reniformis TaxID=1494448 RepID=A0A916XGZ2_9HYPH|nr:hypothetical protein GCM10010994_33950 [Chelatococcus reniformis]
MMALGMTHAGIVLVVWAMNVSIAPGARRSHRKRIAVDRIDARPERF